MEVLQASDTTLYSLRMEISPLQSVDEHYNHKTFACEACVCPYSIIWYSAILPVLLSINMAQEPMYWTGHSWKHRSQ